MAQRKGISTGTTAERTIEEQGKLRFNTTTSLLEYYDGTQWKSIDSPPQVTSIDVTDVASDGGGDQTFVITGSGFSTTITEVRFVASGGGTDVVAGSVTRDSATQLTVTATKSSFLGSGEPFGVKVTNSSGLSSTLASQVNVDSSPIWSTAAGSLGTIFDAARGSTSLTAVATDPDSDAITYSLQSGSLPAGASLTSSSSGAVISGFDAVGSNTTSTFTIRATANSKTADRQFTITINAPQVQTFNANGTFTVPSGLTAVDVLVIAGGGAGGSDNGGGGGAGGLIYRPGFPITPGTPISVTVGDGGSTPGQDNYSKVPGQDSVFGTLTAKGGGGGGSANACAGGQGGSGGGGNGHNGPGKTAGTATQPTQPGDSGNYGFGNNGAAGYQPGQMYGGGGGGAGGAGFPNCGGSSKSYSISGTSVAYAGGGGGGSNSLGGGSGGGGGAGSGGSPGTAATANRGSGGGGGQNSSPRPGGSGGKGIVIVQY
jgi:hypothetical protein